LLDSYQSLEESFSGKLPTSLQTAIGNSNNPLTTTPTYRWFSFTPILATLLAGLAIGALIGFSWSGKPLSTAKLKPLPGVGKPAISGLPDLPANWNTPVIQNQNAGLSLSFDPIQNVNAPIMAIDHLLGQYPTLYPYFRYAADSPTALTLQSSFQVAFGWLHEKFFAAADPRKEEPNH